jgi:hypothetical protein
LIFFALSAILCVWLAFGPNVLKGGGGGPIDCWVPNCLSCVSSLEHGEPAALADEAADQGWARVHGSSF